MNYILQDIGAALKSARERQGLSQRALSEKAGIRQAQISQIENGKLDVRLSSLICLARALNLEVELVPRQIVPALASLIRDTQRQSGALVRGQQREPRAAYSLEADEDA